MWILDLHYDVPDSADVTAGDKALTRFNNLQHTTLRAASRTMCSNRTDLSDLPSFPATALLFKWLLHVIFITVVVGVIIEVFIQNVQ